MAFVLIKTAPVAALLAYTIHSGDGTTIAVVFAALIYVVSVAKDIRPVRALRADLVESRAESAEKDVRIAELLARLTEEVARAEKLAASRDFSSALAEALGGYEKRSDERARELLAAIATHDAEEQKAWEAITQGLAALAPPAPPA